LSYKEDNMDSTQFVKETYLNDNWWIKVDYVLAFNALTYNVLRKTNMDMSTLRLGFNY